jgi:hypothetical protein
MPNAAARAMKRGKGGRFTKKNQDPEPLANDENDQYSEDNAVSTSDNADTALPEGNEEKNDMSDEWDYEQGEGGVATAEAPEGTNLPSFTIEDAPEDYTPVRPSAGRKREPSPFDDVVLQVKDQGWKRVPITDGQGKDGDEARTIKRLLQKSQHFHGLGMELNPTDQYIEFKIRDKQKREKKASDAGQTALDANAEENGDAPSDDRDE